MSAPEINRGPTPYQEIVASEAAKADTESTEFGSSGIKNTENLNSVPIEAQVKGSETANAAFEIETKNAEASDTEVNSAELESETANKVPGEIRPSEVENREERRDDRRANEGRDQEEEGITAGGINLEETFKKVSNERNQGAMEVGTEEEEEETMDPSEISGNLSAALQAIKDNGTFATSGYFSSAPNPALSINGIGMIGLPLSNRDAETIIAAGIQAPFGHGERTVVNKDVRDTWELQPDQLRFLNPAWKDWIERVVMVKVANDLGIADSAQTAKCELHKLLLYKEGGHFLPHKDTEKAPGMFGTLMVILPSFYTGGVVLLSHTGVQKKFDFGGPASLINTSYTAWYTDILHSVLPVTSGYRFALSYNMVHKGSTAIPRLPNTQAQVEDLGRVLRTWNRNADDPESPNLIGWILDHQYSEKALKSRKIEALKGVDKHRSLALLDLAKRLGYELYLAQMEYQVTGTVVEDDYYGGGCGHGYGYGDSDSDPEDKTMDDIVDKFLNAKNFINCKTGKALPPDFNSMFEEENCLPVGCLDDGEPDTKNYEGYAGNEEATLKYMYKRTAVVLWPSAIHAVAVGHLTCIWTKVIFLDRGLWTQEDIDLGKRLRFGEDIITKLSASVAPAYIFEEEPYSAEEPYSKEEPYSEDETLYREYEKIYSEEGRLYNEELMEFTLEEKRLDLFLKMVDIAQSTDIARMTEAASVFGVEGVRDVVQRCISNTKGIENQMAAAIQLYRQQPEELKVVLKRLVDADSISNEVKPEGFRGLLDLMGPELFQTCILPSLRKDHSRTAFWLSFWQHYPIVNFINDTLPEVVHAHEARIHLTKDGSHLTLSSQTLPLLSKALEGERTDLATEIIEKIHAISNPPNAELRLKEQYSVVLMVNVQHIVQILRQHNIPITAEPYANFIKKIFVDCILPTLGPRPRPGEDFRLQTMRTAGQPPCCPNCDMVDIFLSNPWQQTVSYYLVYSLREHLEQKMRERRHISVRNDPLPTRMCNKRNAVPGTITINKVGLSAADAIDKWDRVRSRIERSFIELGDERTRKEVFGGLFPIIQMGVRDYGMGWGKEMEEAVVLSEQEEQQIREKQLRDRVHVVAGMTNHHCEAGPSDENRTPRASLGEANGNVGTSGGENFQTTNTGKKRKRSMQVIDLTDD